MIKTAVVTDSGAALPEKLARQLRVLVAPFTIMMRGESFLDGVDLRPQEFFAELRSSDEIPRTSMVTPRQWLEIFEEAAEYAQEILCVTVSETLSGTYRAARAAAQTFSAQHGIPVKVIDSLTAGGGEGLLVLRAAEWAENLSLDEAAARVRRHLSQVNLFFMVDTLKYAARGGRVSHLASWVSDRLQLKPILSIKDGEVGPVDRPRTRRQGLERLVRALEKHLKGEGRLHVAVNHADALEEAELVLARIQELMQPVSSWISDLTPVLGTHSGPGTIAAASIESTE